MLRMFALNGVLLVWEIRVLVSAGGVRVPAPRASDSTVRLQEHSVTHMAKIAPQTLVWVGGSGFYLLLLALLKVSVSTDTTVRYSHGRA